MIDWPEHPPAEVFPVGHYIAEELEARGWSDVDLARRMGGDNPAVDLLCVQMLLAVHDPNLILDESTARKLARAFGTSHELFLNLDAYYRRYATPAAEAKDA